MMGYDGGQPSLGDILAVSLPISAVHLCRDISISAASWNQNKRAESLTGHKMLHSQLEYTVYTHLLYAIIITVKKSDSSVRYTAQHTCVPRTMLSKSTSLIRCPRSRSRLWHRKCRKQEAALNSSAPICCKPLAPRVWRPTNLSHLYKFANIATSASRKQTHSKAPNPHSSASNSAETL
jgi:hypothetical protein